MSAKRRMLKADLDEEAKTLTKEELAEKYGQLWNTQELQRDYTVYEFLAPFVKVTRKSDGVDGLLMFSHHPRYYHSFKATEHDRDSGIRIVVS